MTRRWLEMDGLLKRRVTQGVWVPLYRSRHNTQGEYGHAGHQDDYEGIRTLAIFLDKRTQSSELKYQDYPYQASPSVWEGVYTRTEAFFENDQEVGVQLCLSQSFDGLEPDSVELNQDLVFGLRLLREGDVWVRPQEGYSEVAKLERDPDGKINGLVIRPDYLKDYLSARRMTLSASLFFERRLTVEDASQYGFNDERGNVIITSPEDGRLELRSAAIHEGGFGFGDTTAVFQVGRTDEWHKDELPVMGPPTEDNTTGESWSFGRTGRRLYVLSSEFRRNEWLEPATASARVAGDRPPSRVAFITDAAGTRMEASELKDEDIGRWLWFSPGVILDLKARRGFSIEWGTAETGNMRTPSGFHVHFGLNKSDLVVTYAYDIAKLDEWEQRIWSGFNVVPEGGIGGEIHRTQVQGEYADTEAPENVFVSGRKALDQASKAKWGAELFGNHPSVNNIIAEIHRFRSLDEQGFLSIAKDLARVLADDINLSILHNVSPPPKDGTGRGSLKSLQRALETATSEIAARQLVGPLVGVYDLRLGDAHLPSSKLSAAYDLAQVDGNSSWLTKGAQLLAKTGERLREIADVIAGRLVA